MKKIKKQTSLSLETGALPLLQMKMPGKIGLFQGRAGKKKSHCSFVTCHARIQIPYQLASVQFWGCGFSSPLPLILFYKPGYGLHAAGWLCWVCAGDFILPSGRGHGHRCGTLTLSHCSSPTEASAILNQVDLKWSRRLANFVAGWFII